MALTFPLLTTKTAPMPRVTDLLYVRHQNRMRYQTRISSLRPRKALGNRPRPAMDLLLDPIRVVIPPSCLRVHTVLISAWVGLVRTRRIPNHVPSNPPLSAHVLFAMTDHLVAPPARLLMVALVRMEPLNGRDLRRTEMSEWRNERPQNGRPRQAQKIWKQVN
jgi:hypothetical protein